LVVSIEQLNVSCLRRENVRRAKGDNMSKSCEIKDPAKHFADWHYAIIPAHWNTLGVVSSCVIDAKKSKALRVHLQAEGLDRKEAMKRCIMRHTHVDRVRGARLRTDKNVNEGRDAKTLTQEGYAFAEGYMFYSVAENTGIRVLHAEEDMIEVCAIIAEPMTFIQPYRLPPSELAEWLRTGTVPSHREISKYQVRSELIRLEIREEL
jgi:hypothetical protein